MGRRILLVPSSPTPNGDLHVGHLAGPYVAMDICKRAFALRGIEAYSIFGTAWHQTQVALKARQLAKSFYETAEMYTDEIIQTLSATGIHPDVFLCPARAGSFIELARDIFRSLLVRGEIVPMTRPAQYCVHCARYLFQAFVVGCCPHCGSPEATGTDCEACARYHDDSDLAEPRCALCGSMAVQRPVQRFYLRLEPFRKLLTKYFESVSMSVPLHRFVETVLAGPLPDVAVSHVADFGVELGVDGFEDQRLYSSFELAGRFLAGVKQLTSRLAYPGDWRDFLEGGGIQTVFFFGFDNAFERCFIFPVVLAAYTRNAVRLPQALIMNHFYLLSGAKFSTMRGHAVWARDLISRSSSDAVRFYVAATRPEVKETDFRLEDFERTVRTELVGGWQGWLEELDGRLQRWFGGIVPEPRAWDVAAREFFQKIEWAVTTVQEAYRPSAFSSQRAIQSLSALVDSARRFGHATMKQGIGARQRDLIPTRMALELLAARALAIMAGPIMPNFSAELLEALGDNQPSGQNWGKFPSWVMPNQRIDALGRAYFSLPKIEMPTVEVHGER